VQAEAGGRHLGYCGKAKVMSTGFFGVWYKSFRWYLSMPPYCNQGRETLARCDGEAGGSVSAHLTT
jgi:hypothetical protein